VNVKTSLHAPGTPLAIDTPIPAAQAVEVIAAHRDRYSEARALVTDPVTQLEAIRAIVKRAGMPGVNLPDEVADMACLYLWQRDLDLMRGAPGAL
jgi:hypothetical protein